MTLRLQATIAILYAFAGSTTTAGAAPPTFTRDVAPILFGECAPCHRPGEAAPFPLLTYQDARKHAKQIVLVTESRFMPPWLPVPGHGAFEDERVLTDAQRSILRDWYEGGTIEGDPADRPAHPSFPEGWRLGEPDLVVEMTDDYTLPADGVDVIRNFVIPGEVTRRRWVEAVELRPGNKRVVHHAVMKVDRTPQSRRLDREDAEAGFPGMALGNAEDPDGHILVWTPGSTPHAGLPGTAWSLRPGDDIVLQLHMVPVGAQEPIRARIGLHFTDTPPERETFALVLREDDIDIPPGERSYTIEDSLRLPVDVDVLGIYPHAHYLGKTMRVTAERADGKSEWLLRIDDWDFNWQGMYRYAEPLRLPAGTTIKMRYTYDNSIDNVRNPNYPPRRVVAGNRSSDEMGNLAIQVVPVKAADLTALREANWRAMLDKDPSDTGALFNLGVEHARRGEHAEAASFYERVIRLDPTDEGAGFALGGSYVKLKDTPRAIEAYERVVRINSRNAEALFLLGWLLTDEGRLDEAERRLNAAVAIAPEHAAAQYRLGVVFRRRGNSAAAIERFREALRLDPGLEGARRELERLQAIPGTGRP